MIKKLTLLAMAVGAVAALVAPGVASATVLKSGGVTITPPKTITGTANNTTTRLETETETFGVLECEQIMLNGEVTVNNGTTAEGVGTAGSTTGGCSFEGEIAANVTNIEIGTLKSSTVGGETGTGTFSAKYAAKLPGEVECKFDTKGANGVFHFVNGADKLIITPTNVTSSGCGGSTLQGEVTLETGTPNDGTPVTGHTS